MSATLWERGWLRRVHEGPRPDPFPGRSGAFSEVKEVTDRSSGKTYAIKVIDKSKCKGKEGMIETEIDILTRVKHENIISMHDSFQIEGKIYLLMEL